MAELAHRIAENLNIPFTIGGGIKSVEDVDVLLQSGADKISVNSAAVRKPQLIDDLAKAFGSQFVVVAIDAKSIDGEWFCAPEWWKNSDRDQTIGVGKGML